MQQLSWAVPTQASAAPKEALLLRLPKPPACPPAAVRTCAAPPYHVAVPQAVYLHGPISVVMNVMMPFRFYSEGVFNNANCSMVSHFCPAQYRSDDSSPTTPPHTCKDVCVWQTALPLLPQATPTRLSQPSNRGAGPQDPHRRPCRAVPCGGCPLLCMQSITLQGTRPLAPDGSLACCDCLVPSVLRLPLPRQPCCSLVDAPLPCSAPPASSGRAAGLVTRQAGGCHAAAAASRSGLRG